MEEFKNRRHITNGTITTDITWQYRRVADDSRHQNDARIADNLHFSI